MEFLVVNGKKYKKHNLFYKKAFSQTDSFYKQGRKMGQIIETLTLDIGEKQPLKSKTSKIEVGEKQRGANKIKRITALELSEPLEPKTKKPDWLRVRVAADSTNVDKIKSILRTKKLSSVCEEASCPNMGECFNAGTATFLIMGDICTRRCPFCDVAHGKPLALDIQEPRKLAEAIVEMNLKYVVITSVNRDDLKDGGAQHFADCIKNIRNLNSKIKIEILTPDFRRREVQALQILSSTQPDVFNHNLETIPDLYKRVRPGANYANSLKLLLDYKEANPSVLTKSGLMLGLGETNEQILSVMQDLIYHKVDMLTLGQYMQPSQFHLPVLRWVSPKEFNWLKSEALQMGFRQVASAPMVRSSYRAELLLED